MTSVLPISTSPSAAPWGSHVRETVLLGLPLIAAQLAQTALNVTNTLVLGRLGPEELAASVLGWQIFFVVWMFGSGFGFAVMPLVAGAIGSNDPRGGRRFVRMGLWVSFAYACLMIVPLWNAHAIFLALGQEPVIAALAADYTDILKWSLFPQLSIIVLRSFLGALGRPSVVVAALVAGVAINAMLNLVFVFGGFGLPGMGMRGAGFATLIATTCVVLFLIAYISRHRILRQQEIFVRFFKPDMPAVLEVFRLGWPIGITIVAEVALFTATSFMMGQIGAMELAAHGIALQLSGLAFMIPLGLSSATTIRVGHAVGRRSKDDVYRATVTSLAMGVAVAVATAALFLTIPRTFVGLYLDLDDAAVASVIGFAVTFLAVAGLFQIVDGVQALSSGALRGMRETRVPMIIALVSYWVIGVPTGYGLAHHAGLGGVGIWWGLAIGLAVAAILMTARLLSRIRSLRY
ncbi:MATE family efflux transporter [Aliihoeflea aestuarii]|uniref:MATE family efflux transporter n=1 Tax=Aliihoeflea aestuarii TaxID=453840 RepID=UPI002093A216|nr:MATE family efflux transporter [Aliihoeflea aestuarii]MCO6391046.1 MATE family efflux transporter [Aliihoeflea aestuarii]